MKRNELSADLRAGPPASVKGQEVIEVWSVGRRARSLGWLEKSESN